MIKYFLIAITFIAFLTPSFSQVENVIVEKYYITDQSDALNTIGGKLPKGYITYRIYVDLAKSNKMLRLFGDNGFQFKIVSTDTIYNHQDEGQSFAKDFVKSRYGNNLVALDSWLTIGQTSKFQGGKAVFGILKSDDKDGSFIGGTNNDNGLLSNNVAEIGLPLTQADGMISLSQNVSGWSASGIKDVISGVDSTIFGIGGSKKLFSSNNFELKCNGVLEYDTINNRFLIAQITSKGELSFKINLEVEQLINGVAQNVKYVSKDTLTDESTIYSPFLSYPFSCGCTDANYLEYDKSYVCSLDGACKTKIILGCMDQNACNYDAKANKNISSLCCYPGYCNNRDLTVVCPSILEENVDCQIYPNPVNDSKLYLDIRSGISKEISYQLLDLYGKVLTEKKIDSTMLFSGEIDLQSIIPGIYQLRVQVGTSIFSKLFIKN